MPFSETRHGSLVCLTSSVIPVPHAFTTRFGGVSAGPYDSLNLGVNRGDDESCVKRNYGILAEALGFRQNQLVFSRQVHGTEVRAAGREDCLPPYAPVPYEADGLLTADTDAPLIIFIADCVPILLCDPAKGVVGAVHAGWRGTVGDIAATAVRKMVDDYGCTARDIRAAIGPSISKCCFETGPEVPEAAEALLGAAAALRFIEPRNGRFMVDLKGINAFRLGQMGLAPENIDVSDACTACQSDKFWSHRKTNGVRGSQAALIFMKGTSV